MIRVARLLHCLSGAAVHKHTVGTLASLLAIILLCLPGPVCAGVDLSCLFGLLPADVLNAFAKKFGAMDKVDQDFRAATGWTLTRALRRAGLKQDEVDKLPAIYHSHKAVFERIVIEVRDHGRLSQEAVNDARMTLESNGMQFSEGQFRRTAALIRDRLVHLHHRTPGQEMILLGLNSHLNQVGPIGSNLPVQILQSPTAAGPNLPKTVTELTKPNSAAV